MLQGLVADAGDLVKLAMAHNGIRQMPDVRPRLAHELADCLWSILALSELYGVNLEDAFFQTMAEIEQRLTRKNSPEVHA